MTATVITGEEDDRTIHQIRAKLFSLDNGQWKERGTGLIKLNIRRSDGTGARLSRFPLHVLRTLLNDSPPVMRKEAVYTVLLNVTLFPGMLCMLAPQDPRYLRFSAIENGSTTHYNLRVCRPICLRLSGLLTFKTSWGARKPHKTC